jgi:lipoate-protein ligase A
MLLSGSAACCRLLVDEPASGGWNMAVDETLLNSLQAEDALIWRFYAWQPGTLSLGYFQNATERTRHAASTNSPLTRRLSGGGAILHDRELTYSVMVPPGHPWSKDVQQLYDLCHQTLIETLRDWRVEAVPCTKPVTLPPAEEPFLCFQRRARGDVLLDGWKVCGSAQRRRQAAVLQHGSILLARSLLAPELPGIQDLQPSSLSAGQLRCAWLERLVRQFGLRPEPDTLTSGELALTRQLALEKYDSSQWIERR